MLTWTTRTLAGVASLSLICATANAAPPPDSGDGADATDSVDTAEATPPGQDVEASPPAPADPAVAQARQLYLEGQGHFELAEYLMALSYWKEAYAKLTARASTQEIRNTLVYNISEAQIKAYEINRNLTHLRKAKLLLEDYLAKHQELYGGSEEAVLERTQGRERLELVKNMLDKGEAAGESASPIPDPRRDGPASDVADQEQEQPEGPVLTPEQQRRLEIDNDPELKKLDKKHTAYIIAGSVTLGVGVLAGGSAIGGSAATPIGALFLGTIGLAGIVTGATLLGVGVKRRKKLRAPVQLESATAWVNGTGGGAAIGLRF